jgi:hypothetical protein
VAFSSPPVSGTAVLEYDTTETLPPVRAILKRHARLCRPGHQASRAQPRGKPGFSTLDSSSGRETDCPLEGDGFELPVPREKASVQKLRRLAPASKVFAFRRSIHPAEDRRFESSLSSGESAANSIFEIPGLFIAICPPNRRSDHRLFANCRPGRKSGFPARLAHRRCPWPAQLRRRCGRCWHAS